MIADRCHNSDSAGKAARHRHEAAIYSYGSAMALLSSSRRQLLIAACSVGLLPTRGLATQQRTVATTEQLDRALAEAEPGDEIILADGEYSAPKPIMRGGTIEKPILIRAANILGAIITSGEVRINADNVIVHGLDSTSNFSIGIDSRAANFRLWRCRIRDNGPSPSIAIRLYDAPDFEGAYCQVGPNWRGRGFGFAIDRGSVRPVWRYSMFRDTPTGYRSGDGEAMHYSFSRGDADADGLIHRCKFKNWRSDPEVISVKCNRVHIKQVCLEDCTDAGLSNRFGHSNTYEGCWTKNSWGISIRDGYDNAGQGHQNKVLGCIVENVTSSDRGIVTRSGDWLPPDNRPSGTGFFPAARNLVISGCSGLVNDGVTVSGQSVQPSNTRIRQHTGTINLLNGVDPDSQPDVAETLYEWSSPIWLEDDDVGPFAG